MSKVTGKKILVYDYGLFLEHSLQLARDGANCRYFTPWQSAFPQFEHFAPGLGYTDEGLEKVYYFWDNIDWADMIFCPDVGPGDMMQYLKDHIKKPIFGAGKGDKLENERYLMRQIQQRLGLPLQKTALVKGVTELKTYLKQNENKYVKLDKFRSDMESFHAKNYNSVKLYLDEIEVALGPFSEKYPFMVEDFIEGIEPGTDLFFSSGEWVTPYLWGIEQSKSCYLGKFVNELPSPLKEITDKLSLVLKDINYQGALSTEVRIDKGGKPYLIDICSRFPAPLSSVYTLAIKNFSDVVWDIAHNQKTHLEVKAPYVAAAPLSTKHAEKNFVKLEFPEKYKDNIKLRVSAKSGNEYFAVKGMEVVFVLVDVGEDYHKLIANIQGLGKEVDAFGLDIDSLSGLNKIEDNLKEYSSYGLEF